MKLRFLIGLLVPLSLALSSCSNDSSECDDGTDNDNDGLIDSVDPGCAFSGGDTEFPNPAACQDGLDNDSDGLIDLEDPGCSQPIDDDESNTFLAQCSDGVDNDSDGLIDFPNDPGCGLSLADSEEDECPDGANCAKCANGIDDDADGLTDYPDDLGCNSAGDNDEFNADPSICGTNVLIQPLPADGQVMGVFTGNVLNELISSECGGNGEEHVFIHTITEPKSVVITTDFPETQVDTVLYVRSECRDPSSELGCNDDGVNSNSLLSFDLLAPGTYYIVVDTRSGGNAGGNYRLSVDTFTPEKEPCDPLALDCAPGLVCRQFTENGTTAASETCEKPECSDGEDSDGDGLIDFPDEPGCVTLTDNDETDDCPTGPNCPVCSNGVDDDGDLLIDYPNDPGCQTAASSLEIDDCITGVPVTELTVAGVTGTTPVSSAGSNFTPSCNTSTAATEDVYAFRTPRNLASITFSTVGSAGDTVLSVRELTCGDANNEVACLQEPDGGEAVKIRNPTEGEFFFLFVDGDFVSSVSYVLNVTGTINLGETCDPLDSVFVCDPTLGLACDVPTSTCVPAACNDGVDNDTDGLIDLFDSGCANIADGDESDDPTIPPECIDGIDNDGDGDIDYPDDTACTGAADNLEEACSDSDPIVDVLTAPITGTTAGSTNDFSPSCQTNSDAGEIAHELLVDVDLESLTIDTNGTSYDTVLTLNLGECGPTAEVICDDDGGAGLQSRINLLNPAQGFYYILVDGFGTNTGTYTLNISGVIAPGGTCDPASTVFTCSSGNACDGGTNTCQLAQCNDGIDNDSDGDIDFPNDPGCVSIDDGDELDDCPSGPNCAACSNGIDDDSDGLTDFPDDPGCQSASDDLEIDDCSPGVPLLALTDAGVTGTTEASGNSDTTPSCNTSTLSSEDEYGYVVTRDLVSLSFSTVGSTGNTVLHVRRGLCDDVNSEIACENDAGGGETVTINDSVNGETLFVIVDGSFVSAIDYVLNVSGTLGLGEACSALDTQFTCDAAQGLACDGSTCVQSQCSDGISNDADGLIDFPEDPGCTDPSDNDELDDCPSGPNCPVCSDGVDNDLDGFTDFPGDIGCQAASDDDELDECSPGVPLITLTDSGATGTTEVSGNSDSTPSCHSSTLSTEDEYAYRVTKLLTNLTFSTVGSTGDTVLAVRRGECSNPADEIACFNGSPAGEEVTITDPVNGETLFVIVDGDFTSAIDYVLNVSGTIGDGEACSLADTQFVCDPALGLACDGSFCAISQCSDGVNNDADATTDFPNDPGCDSPEDDDETDDCPNGANCPECSNGIDDDGDGDIDFGVDSGCGFAGDDLEENCADSDAILTVDAAQIMGDTTGTTDDFSPPASCQGNSAAGDVAIELNIPGLLETLTVDTDGTNYDTVLYMRTPECSSTDFVCDDDGGIGLQSLFTVTDVPAGLYFIIVDGFQTNVGPFTLNVSGVIAAGEACDDAQITAGYLACSAGTTCTAGTCQ